MLTSGEIEVVLETKLLFQKCIDDVRAVLNKGANIVLKRHTLSTVLRTRAVEALQAVAPF